MPLNAEAPPPLGERLKETERGRRIMIVAGEASGDLHGGDLAREILARDPAAICSGSRARTCARRGCARWCGWRTSTVWACRSWPPRSGAPIRAFRTLRRIIQREKPDLVILIDYAEFNLILSGTAKRAGVPVLYYITPQVWAWRRGRIGKLVDRAARLAVVLPFEAELFHRAGDRVSFVGHPLLDRVRPAQGRAETLKRHGFPPRSAHPRDPAGQPPRRDPLPAAADGRGGANSRARPWPDTALALAPTLTPADLAESGARTWRESA